MNKTKTMHIILNGGSVLSYEQVLEQRGVRTTGITHVSDLDIDIPTTIIAGAHAGRTLLITSGIHGAEYCGIAAVMHLVKSIDPSKLAGSLIALHCCNQSAFYGHTVGIMPEDGLNLNRAFPTSDGSTHTHAVRTFWKTWHCAMLTGI